MAEPLKDRLDRPTVELLAQRFTAIRPEFDGPGFVESVLSVFPDLELKDRVNLVADHLATQLPDHYPTALAMVVTVAETGVGEWASWPLCSFVERHGVDWPTESLDAMATLTRSWSCEFAIRPFLEHHLQQTRRYLRRWVLDRDDAVRRLASEGTRPLLPWGPRVQSLLDDPEIGLELLRTLRHDESEVVRRSVANHLNDLAKSRPDLVVETLAQWTGTMDPVDERLVRHGLRTLIKQGHPGALALMGFTTEPKVELISFTCDPAEIHLGRQIELTAELQSTADDEQLLVIDFVVHHVAASNKTLQKVFKWATRSLAPGETVRLTKKRTIQTASTRRYHRGVHRIDLQVAGTVIGSTEFLLTDSSPPR